MATQNINIGVNVSDNGTAKKTVKNFEEIADAAIRAQKAAASINTSTGGTAGSRAVYAKAAPTGSQQVMSGEQYGSARGSAGLTGASARDFANQAQGLGGLVRLYATYAANVFAVSAAFSALKGAMDTTNMIRGLDQLGAASGRNLGALSKRLVEVTDGAISFRDSMDAVAKTSSAGMTNRDIERLAVVAKNASLALGVAMPDAINRLSRGITKLEPELLDELGIFTKIDPAVAAYSRQVGKAASQLTDFERRQAFANAVLAEGEAKFGELATASVNPYDKLLASLKNVSQQALEVVNKVLAPVVELLAASPGALAGAIAVLGTLLVRQALPALTEFKAGLASAAETANELAQRKASDAKNARSKIDAQILAEVETRAAKEIDAVDVAERKIEQLKKAGYSKNSTAAKLLAKDLDDIRKEDLDKQERIAKRLETRATKLAADPSSDPKAVESAKRAAEVNREVVTSITNAQKAQQAYFDTENKIVAEREQAAKSYSVYGLTIQAATAAQNAAIKKGIVSNAAYNASLIGVSGAFRLLSAEITASGLALTAWEIRILKAKAGLAMFVGVMGTLGAAINRALGALGLIVTVLGVLDSVFSNGSKEMSAFTSSIDKLDQAAANAARTLEHLDKRGGYATGTISGISAMANALAELSDSAEDAVKAAIKAKNAMGTWETIKDNFFTLFGGGVDKNLAKALAKDVDSALSLLTRSGLDEQAREKFTAILGIDSLDTKSVEQAILRLSDSAKNNLVTALAESSVELNNSNSRLQSFKGATEATTKAYQDFIVSTANSNPLFKIGTTLQSLAKTMQDVSVGGIREIQAAMIDLAESPQKGILFGSKFTQQLVGLRQGFMDQSAAVTAYKNRLAELDKQIAETSAKTSKLPQGTKARSLSLQEEQRLKRDRDVVQRTFDVLPKDKIQAARDIFVLGMDNAFKEGSKLIAAGLGQSAEKAALTLAKARLGGLSGEERAREENRITQQELKIQMQAIDTNIGLILSQERLRASIDESNSIANLEAARKEGKPTEIIAGLQSAATAATAFKSLLGQGGVPNLQGDVAKKAGLTGGRWTDMQAVALLQQQALQTTTQIAPQLASRTELAAQQGAQSIVGERNINEGRLQDLQERDQYAQALLTQQQESLKLTQSIAGVETTQAILAQNKLDSEQLSIRQNLELSAIQTKIANASPGETKTNLETYKVTLLQTQAAERRNLELQKTQKLTSLELEQSDRNYEVTKSTSDLENIKAQNSLDTRIETLRLADAALNLSKEYVISQQSALEKEKLLLDTNIAMQQEQDALSQKREAAEKRIDILRSDGAEKNKTLIDEVTTELTRQETLTNNVIAKLSQQFNTRSAILDKTKQVNLEQERYNVLLENSKNLASSLGAVFGDVGLKIGEMTSAITEFAITSEKNSKTLVELETKRAEAVKAQNPKKILAIDEEIANQKTKSIRTELAGNAKIAGAAKSLFKEKTVAYKAFAAVEKGLQLASLALEIKTSLTKIGLWAAEVPAKATSEAGVTAAGAAGAAARAPITFGEIIGNYLAKIPPPFGMIAGVAAGAYFLSLLGKSKGSGAPGFTATSEQLQETQGTGMTYNAKGEKVATGGGIFGDDEAKANSVVRSLEILQENSFTSLDYDNKLLRSFQSISSAIGKATNAAITSGLRTIPAELATSLGTTTDKFSLTGVGIVDSIIGGIVGGGYSESRTLLNRRLELQGTFDSVSNDMANGLKLVTDVLVSWQEDGGWLSNDDSGKYIKTTIDNVDTELARSFSDVLGYFKEGYAEIAKLLGKDDPLKFVTEKLKTVRLLDSEGQPLKLDLTGISGADEIRAELDAYFSQINNIALEALFPDFISFKTAGEDYGTTVIRVIQNTEQVRLAMLSIGANFNLTGQSAYKVADSLIEAAGGLDNFVDQTKFFAQNFLTEAERLVPVQAAVTKELARLAAMGYTTADGLVDTRKEFKQLVQTLDVTDPVAREVRQSLMNVQEGFISMTEAMETGLDKTINNFQKFSDNLRNFRDNLVLGSSSILTPLQKYGEAKIQFEDTYAKALRGDEDAQSKLTGSAQTFLTASKEYFASSGQYTRDFNTVLDKVGMGISEADSQITIAKRQLGILESIDANIATIAGVPQKARGGRASGLTLVGELGPELVDFSYPGMVYPADQTRGMFAPQPSVSSNMSQVVQELRQVKQEVAQLRKEQQQQTGELIMTNYDANNRTAEAVTSEVANTATLKEWQQRNKVAVV